MKVAVIITEHFSKQQLEHSYLLSLALLNFDHQVNIVFVGNAFELIWLDKNIQKQWMALKLYGVEDFYQLDIDSNHKKYKADEKFCKQINPLTFAALKNNMDLLL